MHINNMLPVLLDILTGQARQNKVNKAAPRQGTDAVARQGADKTASTAASAASTEVRNTVEGDRQTARQPAPGQGLPDFLPLPLKSPLFTDSRFFIKNEREDTPAAGEDRPASIFIRLRTENLGTLWISLAAGNESLALFFYTENETYTAPLKESFPSLEEGLQKLGYASVNVAGITRPGIKDCSDISPGGTASGSYILDLEV